MTRTVNTLKKSVKKKKCCQTRNDGNSKTSKLKIKASKLNIKKKNRIEKNYSKENIQLALNAMGEGQTLRQAAKNFEVPKSTLYSKYKNLSAIDCKKGPPSVLSEEEENEIVTWILFCAESGHPITKSHLLDSVAKYVTSQKNKNKERHFPFRENRPGKQWYKAFMHRHPNLSQRIAQNLTSTRAAVSESDLRNWFDKVEKYLEKKQLLTISPERIFNLDESSFMLVPKDNSVIVEKGARAPYQIVSSNEKACLTVLFTTAATGQMPPPMILFDLKTTPKKATLEKIPKGWGVGNTEHGWMTAESFHSYISNIFYKWLKEEHIQFPIILYVDGHVSHITLPLLQFCKEHEIELVVLYPNATHILQPLDVAVFHPLKDAYRKTLRQWRVDHNVINVKKSDFAPVLNLTLQSINLTKTIQNGFKSCGLYPFNKDAVNYNILKKQKKRKASTVETIDVNTVNENKDIHLLKLFESKIISPSTLDIFKQEEFSESWSGEVVYEQLFEAWRKLKKLCSNDEMINNDSVKINSSTIEMQHEDISFIHKQADPLRSENNVSTESSIINNVAANNLNLIEFANIGASVEDLKICSIGTHIVNATIEDNVYIQPVVNGSEVLDDSIMPEVEIYNEAGQRITATVLVVNPERFEENDIRNYHLPVIKDTIEPSLNYNSQEDLIVSLNSEKTIQQDLAKLASTVDQFNSCNTVDHAFIPNVSEDLDILNDSKDVVINLSSEKPRMIVSTAKHVDQEKNDATIRQSIL